MTTPFSPLCQPDPGKSCGACCGLYNWKDRSRAFIEKLLDERTETFHRLGSPSVDKLASFRRKQESRETMPRLCDTIYNCPFLGFLDESRRRVGCLLHPTIYNGKDWREVSFYGRELCSEHLCPSHTCLTDAEQQAVMLVIDDWHLYGLVITDIDLVKEYLCLLADAIGSVIAPDKWASADLRRAAKGFFNLKETWPFRSGQPRLGKYFFALSEYRLASIDYEGTLEVSPSTFDRILLSLESSFSSVEQLRAAEEEIQKQLDKFFYIYTQLES